MFRTPDTFGPPRMVGLPRIFGGRGAAAPAGVESEWCVALNGTNGYLNCGNSSAFNLGSGDFSIAMWFRTSVRSLSGPSYRTIASFGPWIETALAIKIRSDTAALTTWWSAAERTTSTATGLDDGLWHHVCYTRSGTTFRLYLDGALVGTSTHSVTFSLSNFMLGVGGQSVQTADGFWSGQHDDVRVYSRALNSTEVAALANNTSPPTDVTAYLPLETGTGTTTPVLDSTGATIATATLVGGATWHPQTPPELVSGRETSVRSLSFDGSDDRVSSSLNLGTLIGGSTCTISCWMLPQGTAPTVSVWEAQVVGDTGQQIGICRAISGGLDRIWAYNWDGGEDKVGATYTTGEWVHVAMVHGSGQLSLYRNGELVGSIASGTTNPLPIYLGVGRTHTGNRTFNGLIDDVRIYSRAIDSTDIQKLCRGQNPDTNDPVGWWKGDETSGTLVEDFGSGGNNGTCVGGVTRSTDVPPWLAP